MTLTETKHGFPGGFIIFAGKSLTYFLVDQKSTPFFLWRFPKVNKIQVNYLEKKMELYHVYNHDCFYHMDVSENSGIYPPNHPLKNRVFEHYKPSILQTPFFLRGEGVAKFLAPINEACRCVWVGVHPQKIQQITQVNWTLLNLLICFWVGWTPGPYTTPLFCFSQLATIPTLRSGGWQSSSPIETQFVVEITQET